MRAATAGVIGMGRGCFGNFVIFVTFVRPPCIAERGEFAISFKRGENNQYNIHQNSSFN